MATLPERTKLKELVTSEQGAIGYILAWLMGVPMTLLLVIWVVRGFD